MLKDFLQTEGKNILEVNSNLHEEIKASEIVNISLNMKGYFYPVF